MKELTLYFDCPADVTTHLEQLLLTLVTSPFFVSLPAEDRSQLVLRHLALVRHFTAQDWQ